MITLTTTGLNILIILAVATMKTIRQCLYFPTTCLTPTLRASSPSRYVCTCACVCLFRSKMKHTRSVLIKECTNEICCLQASTPSASVIHIMFRLQPSPVRPSLLSCIQFFNFLFASSLFLHLFPAFFPSFVPCHTYNEEKLTFSPPPPPPSLNTTNNKPCAHSFVSISGMFAATSYHESHVVSTLYPSSLIPPLRTPSSSHRPPPFFPATHQPNSRSAFVDKLHGRVPLHHAFYLGRQLLACCDRDWQIGIPDNHVCECQ